ncbi:MAG: SIR2 family protein [Pseudolabrys sp.]
MANADAGISQIKESAEAGKLVAVIGSGVSMALTGGKMPALSWKGLVENGFAYGTTKGKITAEQRKAWESQLNSTDQDELLSAAEFMGRKLDAPNGDLYARWLESVFKDVTPEEKGMANAIRAFNSAKVPICTLNYDRLLERVTGLNPINMGETTRVTAWMRREEQGILHIHGIWDSPSTCILGIRDYETTVKDDTRDLIQRALSSFGQLLFIGCGDTFADPNFSALIKWLRENMKSAAPQHYALVKATDEARRHADPSWHGFVEPISYGANQTDLPAFLLKQFPTKKTPTATKRASITKSSATAATHAKVINEYRSFLIKDCGQMTIEGMRADMDTAQRRFDLERLFVPLKLLPTPPEIPVSDPKREEKLVKWGHKNKNPISFGKVFEKHKHLALLALPGGGKTLLLKRLAVAYADPNRRKKSNDELPDLDLMPVLIRCREWKEHIQRPISVFLKNISAITGQPSLADFSDALIPLLKKGRVLLLVDGLDEIHNDADRSTFVDHLESFLSEYKLIRLVVTSREAGFSLVAPSLARFCERFKVASLEPTAIEALCGYWHRLMTGETPESLAEAADVAERLLGNDSLRGLAENPLLLTMLLVVKHGAGRLPPDRVSLYDRAVEVLLDTWNIKGHEPLNLKEAIPQLACVAFELMRKGKQTATEKELLALLEEAREKVPQIKRYAKDKPDQFLKRVELRSSLVVEAGHQLDGLRTVPFYQFRHLTFQEYLAAVAAVEGHYLAYEKGDTVLTPLAEYLTTEEWKEVIPMAAVLARKQAETLIAALATEANSLKKILEDGSEIPNKIDWTQGKTPASVARLVQCLTEEAEASPEIISAALQAIAFFARGCRSNLNWSGLSRGPYGEELICQAWLLYAPMQGPKECWLDATLSALLTHRRPEDYWKSSEGKTEIERLLSCPSTEQIARGLLTIVGFHVTLHFDLDTVEWLWDESLLNGIEAHMFNDNPAVWDAAVWAWAHTWNFKDSIETPGRVANRLLSLWLIGDSKAQNSSYAFCKLSSLPRRIWTPILTSDQKSYVQIAASVQFDVGSGNPDSNEKVMAALLVAFFAGDVFSEEDLADRLKGAPHYFEVKPLLKQMGEIGESVLHHLKVMEEQQLPGKK